MIRYTIHETYEYHVEADSSEQAQQLFEACMEDGLGEHRVVFTQNYTHIFDNEGNEV